MEKKAENLYVTVADLQSMISPLKKNDPDWVIILIVSPKKSALDYSHHHAPKEIEREKKRRA
jgi:hypothetical protein